nr:GNAT family N-acetyltransferase [Hyphomonas sp.]
MIGILYDTFESTWRPNITQQAAESFRASKRPETYVGHCWQEFYVVSRAGTVAGFVHWRDDFVHALHVHSDYARTGVGTQLMDLAEGEIARAGFPTARLETDTFNTRSQAFYTARGYVEKDRYPDLEWNSNLTTLLLEKGLVEQA